MKGVENNSHWVIPQLFFSGFRSRALYCAGRPWGLKSDTWDVRGHGHSRGRVRRALYVSIFLRGAKPHVLLERSSRGIMKSRIVTHRGDDEDMRGAKPCWRRNVNGLKKGPGLHCQTCLQLLRNEDRVNVGEKGIPDGSRKLMSANYETSSIDIVRRVLGPEIEVLGAPTWSWGWGGGRCW